VDLIDEKEIDLSIIKDVVAKNNYLGYYKHQLKWVKDYLKLLIGLLRNCMIHIKIQLKVIIENQFSHYLLLLNNSQKVDH